MPAAGPGWFYPPTVLLADTPEPESRLAGVFGPVVLVRGFPDPDAAVAAANSGDLRPGGQRLGPRPARARDIAWRTRGGDRHHQRGGHPHRPRLGPVRRDEGERLRADPRRPRPARVHPAPGRLHARRPAASDPSSSPTRPASSGADVVSPPLPPPRVSAPGGDRPGLDAGPIPASRYNAKLRPGDRCPQRDSRRWKETE